MADCRGDTNYPETTGHLIRADFAFDLTTRVGLASVHSINPSASQLYQILKIDDQIVNIFWSTVFKIKNPELAKPFLSFY
jgi:hypothetical protein